MVNNLSVTTPCRQILSNDALDKCPPNRGDVSHYFLNLQLAMQRCTCTLLYNYIMRQANGVKYIYNYIMQRTDNVIMLKAHSGDFEYERYVINNGKLYTPL